MKLPRVEFIIIAIFFLCIALWAISKCAAKREALPALEPDPVEAPDTKSEAAQTTDGGLPKLENPPPPAAEPAPANTAAPATNNAVPGAIPKLSNETQATQPASQPATAEKQTTLFVTIDGLKMRKEPNLQGPVVTRLKLDEQVIYLNEKSKEPQEISLGYETVTDYWVKVRSKSGKEGWVFGAGLHFYKMKRKGVMEK